MSKIIVSMKSTFAYERFVATCVNLYDTKTIEFNKTNITTLKQLDDLLDFEEADLYIIDQRLDDFSLFIELLESKNQPYYIHEGDYKESTNYVSGRYSLIEKDPPSKEEGQEEVERVPEVIIKERIVQKEIYKQSYLNVPNRIIVVGSMWSGAGSTTVGINLAKSFAERGLHVSYVEHPLIKPYMFDYLDIPNKEKDRKSSYQDLAHMMKNQRIINLKNQVWVDNQIEWFVNDSRLPSHDHFSYEYFLKMIYSINTAITIVDVSSLLFHHEIIEFIYHADEVLVCLEPDPVKVDWLTKIEGNEKIQRSEKKLIDFLNEVEEKEGIEYQFVLTKYTKQVDINHFLMNLDKKPLTYFPVIPYETLLKNVWKYSFLYDDKSYQSILENTYKPIIIRNVPRQFYRPKDSKTFLKTIKKYIVLIGSYINKKRNEKKGVSQE